MILKRLSGLEALWACCKGWTGLGPSISGRGSAPAIITDHVLGVLR